MTDTGLLTPLHRVPRKKSKTIILYSSPQSSIPSSTRSDIGYLETYLSRFADHPNYLLYGEGGGRALISTFAGERALFGHETLSEAWSAVRRQMENIRPVRKNFYNIFPCVLINILPWPCLLGHADFIYLALCGVVRTKTLHRSSSCRPFS